MINPPLGVPRGCIYTLGESWVEFPLAFHEILAWELSFHKIASPRFSWFAALPCRSHISRVRTPNKENSESKLCGTKLSETFLFMTFLENEVKIPKTTLQDNLSEFGLFCAACISGAISPSSIFQIMRSIGPNRSLDDADNFGIQHFVI